MTVQIVAHMFTLLHELDSSYVLIKPKEFTGDTLNSQTRRQQTVTCCTLRYECIGLTFTEIEIKYFGYL